MLLQSDRYAVAGRLQESVIPYWLHTLSIIYLAFGGLCALVIAVDILLGRHQHMWIMNVVWPASALFGTGLWLYWYFKYGRLATHHKAIEGKQRGEPPPGSRQTPFWMMVAKGASHCGSGCTIGDILAEFLALSVPAMAIWLG